MDTTEQIEEAVRLTADMVVFCYHDARWYVLLIVRGAEPYAGCLALPGGHVETGESTKAAAIRELAEETGLRLTRDPAYRTREPEPLGVYAEAGRDPRGRYVTFAYVTYVRGHGGLPEVIGADDAHAATWIPVEALGAHVLAFDHDRIVSDAWVGPVCSPVHGCGGVHG